jgi:hypothetical protein
MSGFVFGGANSGAFGTTPSRSGTTTPQFGSASTFGSGASGFFGASGSTTSTSSSLFGAPTTGSTPAGINPDPFASFGAPSAAPAAITTPASGIIEPPSQEIYAVGGYGRSYPGWRRMTGDEFKAQAAAVVDAHTRGQGIHVMDAAINFRAFSGGANLYFDPHMRMTSDSAGTLYVTKSAAGRAQFQTEKTIDGVFQVTRWMDLPPSLEELAQFSPSTAFFLGGSDADIAALFARIVRFSVSKSRP